MDDSESTPTALAPRINGAQVQLDAVPLALQEMGHWVLWRYADRGGRPTKEPCQIDGRLARTNDPATWATFGEACQRYLVGGFAGLGYVFSRDDEFCGIDLDGCRDPKTGVIADWANDIIERFDSYAEVSPSKAGVKIFCRGRWPLDNGKRTSVQATPLEGKEPAIEVYDHGRYFAVTGWRMGHWEEPQERQQALDWLKAKYWPAETARLDFRSDDAIIGRARKYLVTMAPGISGQGGHNATFRAACVLVCGFELGEQQALELLLQAYNARCQPPWSEAELRHKVRDAAKQPGQRGYLRNAAPARWCEIQIPSYEWQPERRPIERFSFAQLLALHPQLHPPVVEGLFREGETANIISVSKIGKSWLAYGLALSIITGRHWLGRFKTSQGRVLLIDNELHKPTLVYRIKTVADALAISAAEYEEALEIWPLRGNLRNVFELERELSGADDFRAVILDAKYRMMPPGASENDNSAETQFFNVIDRCAELTGAAFVNVHHSSKGSQADKRVTDVGAGAGAQSRAADCHLVMREHEDDGVMVLDAAVRSFAPVEPLALRWVFPVWRPAEDIDPALLRGRLTAQEQRQFDRDREGMQILLDRLDKGSATCRQLRDCGLSPERVTRLLGILESKAGGQRVEWTATTIRGNETRLYRRKVDENGRGR